MSITLPPLPERPWRMFCTKCGRTTPLDAKDVQHSPPGSPFVSHFGVCPCGYQALAEQAPWTADQLRARDLEVAQLVLEAAGDAVKRHNSGMVYTAAMAGHVAAVKHDCLAAIRALEVKHHE